MTSITTSQVAESAQLERRRRRQLFLLVALVLVLLNPVGPDRNVFAVIGQSMRFEPVSPARLVDTRIDLGVERIDANTLRVQVAGVGDVPANAAATYVTVAATDASEQGYLVAYPTGEARPNSSNLNYQAGHTFSTGVIVGLGNSGSFDIYTLNPVNVVVDVTGVFVPDNSSAAGRFIPVSPSRLVDSRSTGWVAAGQTVNVPMPSSVPKDASAAIVTLTSTAPNSPGYFTAFDSGAVPNTSTLNLSSDNSTRATTAIIPLSNRSMKVFSSNGGHVIVDLIGYFSGPSAASSSVGLFVPTLPTRRTDTRQSAALGTGETRSFAVDGGTVVGSLTMIQPGSPGYGALFSNGSVNPGTSAINLADADVIANMAVSRVSSEGVNIYSSTYAHFAFDQFGYFTTELAPITAPLASPNPNPTFPTQPTVDGCGVSDLLVPSCGAWFGASTASRDGQHDYARGLVEYENVVGNVPDILHFYKTGAQKFPTAAELEMSERPGKQRSLLMYNWKPSTQATWREIAQGGADSEIATVAASLKTYPHKLFLNIYHEPEDNVNPSSGSGMTPEDYAAMYRHVVTQLRQHGVTNAVFVWNTMGYYGWAEYLDGLYPGAEYVDWLCYDPYMRSDRASDIGELVNKPRPELDWPGYYSWATAKAPGKPLMLCEWGVDLITNTDPASLLAGDAAQLLGAYPMLKGLIYWNSVDEVNARLDEPGAKGAALGAAFRQFAAQPYFNSTPTSAAP